MPARPVYLLLPPSKGKADDVGATGAPYPQTLDDAHPLTDARRRVFAALLAADRTLTRPALLRLYGVADKSFDQTRAQNAALAQSPTRPARERYCGVVYNNAELTDRAADRPDVTVLIVSALLGVADVDEPVPNYRTEFGANLPPFGSLARFWADAAHAYLRQRLQGCDVWDLLPNEHRGILPDVAPGGRRIDVQFLTPSGARANAARTKVAKGQIVAFLRQKGPMSAVSFARRDPLAPQWQFVASGNTLTATCHL